MRTNFVCGWPDALFVQRIAEAYLESGNDWAETDEDEEALEIRGARTFARALLTWAQSVEMPFPEAETQ